MHIWCWLFAALAASSTLALKTQPLRNNPLKTFKAADGARANEVMKKLPQDMQTSLETLASAACNESLDGFHGTAYRGCQTKTRSGKNCQRWTRQSPHKHDRTDWRFPGRGLGDHSFCRNPDDEDTIWCYTDDAKTRWEYCDPKAVQLPMLACVETLSGRRNIDYRGCQSTTRSGRTCQKWSKQSPHKHDRSSWRFPGRGLGDHNYCRNPDDQETIWCYTDDKNTRWEYCDPKVEPDSMTSGSMAECPSDNSALVSVQGEDTDEYYNLQHIEGEHCDLAQDMWYSEAAPSVLQYKYNTVSELMGLGPGYRVLDWGAGCAHNLDLVAGKRGFKGVALDLVVANAKWGHKNLHHLTAFCAADGAKVQFPANSFDAVLSNSALHHVKTKEAQCDIVRKQILRMLRPGGCAWFGWLGSSGAGPNTVPPEFWASDKCMGKDPVVVHTASEQELFGMSEHAESATYSLLACNKGITSDTGSSVSASLLGHHQFLRRQ